MYRKKQNITQYFGLFLVYFFLICRTIYRFIGQLANILYNNDETKLAPFYLDTGKAGESKSLILCPERYIYDFSHN